MSTNTPITFRYAVLDPSDEAPRKARMMPQRLLHVIPSPGEAGALGIGGGVFAYVTSATTSLSVNEKVTIFSACIGALILGLGPPLKRAFEEFKGSAREQRLKDREAERSADAADREADAAGRRAILEELRETNRLLGLAQGEAAAARTEATAARAEATAARAETAAARYEATAAREQLKEALAKIGVTVSHTDKNVSQLKDGNPDILKATVNLAVDKTLKNEADIKAINARLSGDDIPVSPPVEGGR